MSFMYNPFPYDDPNAVNHPELEKTVTGALKTGTKAVADTLAADFRAIAQKEGVCIVAFEGYISADWKRTLNLVAQNLEFNKTPFEVISFREVYKSAEKLDEELEYNVGTDLVKDPVSLFGKVYDKGFEGLFEADKVEALKARLAEARQAKGGKIVIVWGNGCTVKALRGCYDRICYFDVTPKETILRARRGAFCNIGDTVAKPVKALIRRCYYVDFVVAFALRGELLHTDAIDFYLASDHPDDVQLLPGAALNELFAKMVKYPFRCKPVYIEGVWGGTYFKKHRHLPDNMVNSAWIFDLIPMEVSLVMQVGKALFEVPFQTFFQKEGVALMGADCVKKYGGFFPIRFNYDDSYHSNGNMSIQVHSGKDYNIENFNELGRQDESYYIVATGHGAKTYVGWQESADPKEFIELAKKSEKDHSEIDYRKYVNWVESKPGVQVLLPAGTIHSSGRNQVVLEIGSLTFGSYTYKMYDYVRKDLDGIPRPIHTYHGERVLRLERNTTFVNEQLCKAPVLLRKDADGEEYIVGKNDLLYFELHRLEFEKQMTDETKGKFHVLVLVDGEKVRIESIDHPEYSFEQNFLDMVVVPANIGRYRIVNLGNQPVCVHKTLLKDGFVDDNQ